MEERTPHIKESTGWRNLAILATRESPKRSLRRWQRRFGERGSGVEEETKRYLHPNSFFYRLTARGGNSGPGVEFLAPRISGVSG
jgi:hypothetical protein